jgi:hypothetical protein
MLLLLRNQQLKNLKSVTQHLKFSLIESTYGQVHHVSILAFQALHQLINILQDLEPAINIKSRNLLMLSQ